MNNCPVCFSEPTVDENTVDENVVKCSNNKCPLYYVWSPLSRWNYRPKLNMLNDVYVEIIKGLLK